MKRWKKEFQTKSRENIGFQGEIEKREKIW